MTAISPNSNATRILITIITATAMTVIAIGGINFPRFGGIFFPDLAKYLNVKTVHSDSASNVPLSLNKYSHI